MASRGFNNTQLKQLSDMFYDIVDTLSKTFTKQLLQTEENIRTELKNEIIMESKKTREEVANLSLTMATKYKVDNHEKRIVKIEKKVFRVAS